MALNNSIHYVDGQLAVDQVFVSEITQEVGTPVYIYSLKRALENYQALKQAFAVVDAEIHYSAKANANLRVLSALIQAGAGIDAVSAGEIHRAIEAGAEPADIVFAGVGKHPDEIRYAVEQGVGWFNVENVGELAQIQAMATALRGDKVRVALRLNPEVTANTHPYIATGHGGAKFGLTAEVIRDVLANQDDYPNVHIAGLHLHIGSQLGDTQATRTAIEKARDLIQPYPNIQTLNIGGGFPAAYEIGEQVPDFAEFAHQISDLIEGYHVILEPGRSIIGDAGILVSTILYTKQQAGQMLYITDASMTDLIRPALYQAKHTIVAVQQGEVSAMRKQIVGPVCESADVLGRDVPLADMQADEQVALLTAGAYGMVMASNYNARLRPAEVVVHEDGKTWSLARRRETWDDLLQAERNL
jgi:diaminopimelate decarboxylase